MLFQLKAFWNRKVLTWHQNVINVGARRISVRRAFHSLGAAAEKALCLQAHTNMSQQLHVKTNKQKSFALPLRLTNLFQCTL